MKSWKDIKIMGKLLIGFGTVMFLLVIVSIWTFIGMTTIVPLVNGSMARNVKPHSH